jgi:hypothetical protein
MLLTAGEIVAKSWREYRENFHAWAIFGFIIFVPTFVLTLSGTFGGFLNVYLPATTIMTNVLIVIIAVASAVLGFWSSLALISAVIKYLQTKKTDHFKEHYSAAFTLIWPAFYTSLLVALFVLGGTILFIIPGIIVSIWYHFSVYNMFTSGEKGFAALESSKKLVRGRWWSVAWRILVPAVIVGLGVILVQLVIDGVLRVLPVSAESYKVLGNIAQALVSSMIAPLSTLVSLNLFFSLRDNPFREPPILLASEPPEDK